MYPTLARTRRRGIATEAGALAMRGVVLVRSVQYVHGDGVLLRVGEPGARGASGVSPAAAGRAAPAGRAGVCGCRASTPWCMVIREYVRPSMPGCRGRVRPAFPANTMSYTIAGKKVLSEHIVLGLFGTIGAGVYFATRGSKDAKPAPASTAGESACVVTD